MATSIADIDLTDRARRTGRTGATTATAERPGPGDTAAARVLRACGEHPDPDAPLTDLARALWQLRAQQRAAVLGSGDPDALDDAILAFRQAQAAAVEAALLDPDDAVPAASEQSFFDGLFARWLVEAAHDRQAA